MFGCYCLQYLDKSLLNYASVMGILEDANLTTEQYGTLSLIFYVAFLAFELPHAYCLVSSGSSYVQWFRTILTGFCSTLDIPVHATSSLCTNAPTHRQRFPTAKYLGTMVCCWGAVVACTSACNSYASLVATRFLLGMFESCISPSLILITSMW